MLRTGLATGITSYERTGSQICLKMRFCCSFLLLHGFIKAQNAKTHTRRDRNRLISIFKNESINDNLSKQKVPDPDRFTF